MQVVKGNTYFNKAHSKIKNYGFLDCNLNCGVLIIGGGIDGAIANYYLSQHFDCALVDAGFFASGCTCAATALLEYQLDSFAKDLKGELSESEVIQSYKMGQQSVSTMQQFIKKHGNHCNFNLRPTFMYTNNILTALKVKEEYEFRNKNGFNVKLFEKENNPFKFDIKAGIFASDGGAECNPYLLTKQLIENSKNQNKIFQNTKIVSIEKNDGKFVCQTVLGHSITCQRIVMATGFDFSLLKNPPDVKLFVTYSIVTKPIKNFCYHQNALVHNVASPYYYSRVLEDGRIIFGGEDTPYKEIIEEGVAEKKYNALLKQLKSMLKEPDIKIEIEHSFCGIFGSTKNNLGVIGECAEDKNILCFFSCGANGIINAFFGQQLLIDLISGKQNALAPIFSPRRQV